MKKPMTTAELYEKVCSILKEQGKLPDILDYGLPAYHPVPITNYEFELRSNLHYGGSEGIYLDFTKNRRNTENQGACYETEPVPL